MSKSKLSGEGHLGKAQRTTQSRKHRHSIAEVVEMTGISAHLLRIWELRYGWPKPERKANGYRAYPADQVRMLEWAGVQIQRGRSIGDIIRDPLLGFIERSTAVASREQANAIDFTRIPEPLTADGKDLRRALERAIATGDRGTIARLEAECQRLKPDERERACLALLRLIP
jgi:DNA-binding transcriptional MerR regulator